jgi:ribonucleoside-diphosphate reductase beta chain
MIEYREYVADSLLVELECEKEYCSAKPFNFMDMINIQGKPISLKNELVIIKRPV